MEVDAVALIHTTGQLHLSLGTGYYIRSENDCGSRTHSEQTIPE